MLKIEEISQLIESDKCSDKKRYLHEGKAYYDGNHDIKKALLFYYNSDGELVEDKYRSNIKICHPFYTELVDQLVQYVLSSGDIIKSNNSELQPYLDEYFNHNDEFYSEFSEAITNCVACGHSFMYAYKNSGFKTSFQCADASGVVEVRAKDAEDGCEYIIYWYVDRIDKNKKEIKKIQVWNKKETYYYIQDGDSGIREDDSVGLNPRPHILYTYSGDNNIYYEDYGVMPFFRLDNNKKQMSGLSTIKELIDDYDLMASSLSNNLVDFDTPIHVVKGFKGNNLDELQQNLKTKKIIGIGEGGEVDVKTVDIPYQARLTKLELDEKNIYRFGMGLNTAGLKDTTATTNIAIKAAYSLLDLKASKLEIRLKQFLRKIVKLVIDEVNKENNTNYKDSDVFFEFNHEVMSNQQENAQILLTEAQTRQVQIGTLLSLGTSLDDETLMKNICETLDINYEEIKSKLPKKDEAIEEVSSSIELLDE